MNDLLTATLEHIHYLAETIGPRPAGSSDENNALLYACQHLKKFGYTIQESQVRFPKVSPVPLFNLLAALLTGLSCLVLFWFPYGAMVLPLIIAAAPQLGRWALPKTPRPCLSKNLLGFLPQAQKKRVLLVAHIDTAPVFAFSHPLLLKLQNKMFFINERVAIAACALGWMYFIGFTIPTLVFNVIALAGALSGGLWLFFGLSNLLRYPEQFSYGAFDNASGVAVLLSTAAHFASTPCQKLNLQFLITSAEETGLHGAWSFLEDLPKSDMPDFVLNLDMVGAGHQLEYILGDGIFQKLITDPYLNGIIKKLNPLAIPVWNTLRGGDYLPFLLQRIPCASIQSNGSATANLAYHTKQDRTGIIQFDSLEQVLQLVIQFIETLDAEA